MVFPSASQIAGTTIGLLLAASPLAAQTSGTPGSDRPAETLDDPTVEAVESGTRGAPVVSEAAPHSDPEPAPAPVPDPASTPAPEPVPPPAAAAEAEPSLAPAPLPDAAATALAECRATNESLRTVIFSQGLTSPAPAVDTSRVEALQTELNECRQDERLNRTTNARLNEELSALRARVEMEDVTESGSVEQAEGAGTSAPEGGSGDRQQALLEVQTELAKTRVELDAANARVAVLTGRLESIGAGVEPGFRYAGTVDESYMRRDVAQTRVREDLKLSADQCAEALEWLETQNGLDLWLRKLVWVWNEEREVQLCAPTASGEVSVTPASPSDEAHAIIFE